MANLAIFAKKVTQEMAIFPAFWGLFGPGAKKTPFLGKKGRLF